MPSSTRIAELKQPLSSEKTIIAGFKATEEKSGVMVTNIPSYDPKTMFGGASFLGCNLEQKP